MRIFKVELDAYFVHSFVAQYAGTQFVSVDSYVYVIKVNRFEFTR